MKTIKAILATALFAFTLNAAAETSIAVVDPIKAIGDTALFKERSQKIQSDIEAQGSKLRGIREEVMAIEQRLKKDGMTMSKDDQKKLVDERDGKMIEFQSMQQVLEKRVQQDRQELIQLMEPKLEQSVAELASDAGFDLVLNSQAALFHKDGVDITEQVTQKINQMK